MACGIADATIEFPLEGITIAPYSIDLRVDRDKFDHARCEVSREAAELISDKLYENPNQPVKIYINGDRLFRKMYLHNDAIEYGDEEAYITLMDPLHVTTQGVCDKTFNKGVTLADALDYVMSRVIDPNGVIKGWGITDPKYANSIQPNYQDLRDASLFELAEDWFSENLENDTGTLGNLEDAITGSIKDSIGAAGDVVLWTNREIDNLTNIYGDTGKLDFDQISPHKALKMICEEWEIDVWVDQNRKLWLGKRETTPKTHISTPKPNTLAISEYNVSKAPFPVAEVFVKGGKSRLNYDVDADGDTDGSYAVGNRGVKTWGQARVDGLDNGKTITVKNKDLQTGEAIKKAAEQRLIKEMASNESGNIKLNPAVSGYTQWSQPQTINIGDYIIVEHPDHKNCNGIEDIGGQFLINGVHHRIDGENGWTITIDVTHVPAKKIRSRFFYYKPETGEIVSEGDLYAEGSYTTITN